jgi:Ca-activated chloride channel family protein
MSVGSLATAAVLSAQEPLHFRSASSDLVVLSASVTDSEGGFVSDVEGDRFAIFDDGKPQPIALFSNEDSPVSVGLIIDNSASMRPKTGEVVAATVEFARSSNPRDELFALSFNDDVREALPDRRFLLADDIAALEQGISSLRPEGRTSLYDAVIAGLDRLDEGSRARKVLVVLSDGGDNASRATLDDVLARAQRSDATIYTIGLFDNSDRDRNPGVLQDLARTTGGERYLPQSAGRLMQACQRIARDIRSGYTLAFEPVARDGKHHSIEVKVNRANGRKLSVRARTGYVAPVAAQP